MKATLDDLRGALHAEADAAAYPDVDALVAGARRRVAASRRRRLAVLGSVTAAVLVVGGLVVTRPTHQGLPQPAVSPTAGLGPFTVNASGSGFPGYSFPDYYQGMKRLTVLDAPMLEQLNGSISIPTAAGQRLAVAMTCTPYDGDRVAEWLTRMRANFTIAGSRDDRPRYKQSITCLGSQFPDAVIGIATSAKTTVLADVMTNHKSLPMPRIGVERVVAPGLLFKDAKIHVAIYETVPWQDYPLPPRPADLDTNAQYAWSSDQRVLGPTTTQEANKPLTFTRPSGPNLSLNLEVRGPGRMRVLIDGKDVSELVAWQLTQDKFIAFWGYTSTGINIPLDPLDPRLVAGGRARAAKPGTPVTVTIYPQDFQGPDWQITVPPDPTSGG